MTASEATVACGNCGRQLDERTDLPVEERQPCPVCGSTARSFSVTVTAAVGVASVMGAVAHVGNVPAADQTPEAEAIRGRYRATLDWYKLEDGHWMLHVLNERGEVVEGGIGDDTEEALLEVYERLIPPS
jgi:hypothetical protein